MLWQRVLLLLVVARSAVGFFNFFLTAAEVRRLMGKNHYFRLTSRACTDVTAETEGAAVCVRVMCVEFTK